MKKNLLVFVGIAGLAAVLYILTRKKKIPQEIKELNSQIPQNETEKKQLLDDIYVAYTQNWGGVQDGYKRYQCAFTELQAMNVDELKKVLEFWKSQEGEILKDPIKYRAYMELKDKFPAAFRANPCEPVGKQKVPTKYYSQPTIAQKQ